MSPIQTSGQFFYDFQTILGAILSEGGGHQRYLNMTPPYAIARIGRLRKRRTKERLPLGQLAKREGLFFFSTEWSVIRGIFLQQGEFATLAWRVS